MDHISHVSKMEDLLLIFFTNRQIDVVQPKIAISHAKSTKHEQVRVVLNLKRLSKFI